MKFTQIYSDQVFTLYRNTSSKKAESPCYNYYVALVGSEDSLARMDYMFGLPIEQQSRKEADEIAIANFYDYVGLVIDEMIRAGLPNPYDERCIYCPCDVED